MPQSHQFVVQWDDWPTNAPAKRAYLTITRPNGERIVLRLNAGELRRLARAALVGLGYTKVARSWHGKQAGWQNRIEAGVQPIMKMAEMYFPKNPPKSAAS